VLGEEKIKKYIYKFSYIWDIFFHPLGCFEMENSVRRVGPMAVKEMHSPISTG
jgi:hypothetical protein